MDGKLFSKGGGSVPEGGGDWRLEGSDQQKEHLRQQRVRRTFCDGAEGHDGKEEERTNRALWGSGKAALDVPHAL